ncbi:chromosome segregation ATPase [Pleurocapsales cyanobacterium LEGE 10410]|nr:chromosome segregation ATPase [Pleurocapsales cyanobacterium LEGE 10410]
MASDKKPQNTGSDATSKTDPKINGDNPQQLDLSSSFNHDFSDNLLVPVTAQTTSASSGNANLPVGGVTSNLINNSTESTTIPSPNRPWWQMWQLWGILLVLCSGGLGYGATSMLLKLPKTQNCSQVFWPIASASVRLYCAQTAAEDNEVEDLLSAIKLVAVLPESHPLRPEIDRNINRWATSILNIAEEEFQTGDLDKAIATARKIPENVSAKEIVEEKIADWQSVWSAGEEIYLEVENQLREANWNGAFNWAVRLTDSPNEYWATTKYEESINNINIAQEENATLSKAKTQVTSGKIDDLISAINKAGRIDKKGYAYEQAQAIIAQAKAKLVANIEQLIKQQDWRELILVTGRIPRSLKLQERTKDWQILANAGSSAKLDTVFGLEEAIEEAQKLEKDSEYYRLGQKLISRWELEIDDVRHLSKAREFARVGTMANLNKAIAEAGLIVSSNPRYGEARQQIAKWRGQIRTIEDRPVLNRARELSYGNNVNAWQKAIAEVNLISRNSPLYNEAQQYARTWRANIERVQDRPILDRAQSLANLNNYLAAIDTAEEIRSGRALYPEAQSKIALWRQEIDGTRYLREAREIARRGTPESLARAIRVGRQVSPDSTARPQIVRDVNDWAAQILAIARQTSDSSLERAISIAQQVPSGTTSFSAAQKDLKIWRIRLNPPRPEIIPPTFKLDKLRKERGN